MTNLPLLDNPRSDRIKAVAALAGRSTRKRSGRILVEGPQAVRELVLHRPRAVIDVYITDELEMRYPGLADAARGATKWVHNVTLDVAKAISPDCQGIVAVAQVEAIESDAASVWETLKEGGEDAAQFLVCLPETQDPGNVGTIIRTADAMGASAVVLGAGTADPANPKVIRSSAGSVFHLPVLRVPLETVQANVTERRWPILGTSGHGADITLDTLAVAAVAGGAASAAQSVLSRPHVWVFGNEARGLSAEDVALCDLLVEIPIAGEAESLNAAAAAAMCMYASHLGARRPRNAEELGSEE